MNILAVIAGCVIIAIVLWDAFEAIILPRRVTRKIRLTRLFYLYTWIVLSAIARRMRSLKRREKYLSFFGPLSLIMLLLLWAVGLMFGFALIHWALGTKMGAPGESPAAAISFATYFYMSGTTFSTLGFGDVVPVGTLGRFLAVMEAGMGFGFLAIVIGYLPVLYQAFSRREVNISLLDARAGSPSSAGELLRRHAECGSERELTELLRDWERWSAELMESHLSYPVLSYFRSQHDNQSWLSALTTILDTCAFVMSEVKEGSVWQARLTFAIARHAVVDLSQVFGIPPTSPEVDRLKHEDLVRIRRMLASYDIKLHHTEEANPRLKELRHMYEPYVNSLSRGLLMQLPPWIVAAKKTDNWQTSAYERSVAGATSTPLEPREDEHTI
ncbi:MAG TPA: potassium channel family protein [Pyrinomonadaceae bacterium]|jgi:hypothetical protein